MHGKNLHICDNPLLIDRLAHMRSKDTDSGHFKFYLDQISYMLAYEAARFHKTKKADIETPVAPTTSTVIDMGGHSPVLVPILRAGLGLMKGFEYFYPNAGVGHVGVYRDEETKRPVEYLLKLPEGLEERTIFLLDPMLATGHSAIYAADLLLKNGAKSENIIAAFLIAAPEGVKEFQAAHPDIAIVCGALDEKLNDKAYIVPGLGDAGDRIFGTD